MKCNQTISAILCLCLCSSMVGCTKAQTGQNDDIQAETAGAVQTTAPVETQETAASDTTESVSPQSDADLTVSIQLNSSWDSGGATTYDYNIKLTNHTKKPMNNWVVTIPTAGGKVGSAWSTKYTEKDGVITATPESYNGTIEPNQTAEFGMQIIGGAIDNGKVTVKADEGELSVDVSDQNNQNNNQQQNQNQGQQNTPSTAAKDVPKPTTDDWLTTKGSKIVDKDGREVWLTGCNWFGYNTGTNCFDGLWACDLDSSLSAIADHGFNLLRIPISTELVNNWEDGNYPTANYNNATNSYLNGMNSLEIFDYVVGQCRANGLKIMMDFHCAVTDSMGHMKPLWVDGNITENDYFRALSWIAERYKNDDTIVAIDLENEPHGKPNESPRAKWDNSKDSDNWKYIAEQAAGKVLDKNPNLLVMVEGIEIYPTDTAKNGNFASQNSADYYYNWWGGNLRGVADNPVNLGKHQKQLVYSPHDYGPAVYQQPWFQGSYDYNSLQKDCWYDNWFYIQDKNIAPLLIGEWGGYMTEPNLTWMTYLRKYIKENKINHTFWCFNSNSGDTGGLVLDDFTTWDNEKYEFVKDVLWQKDGKFVSLDHEIPLGANGISLSQYSK